MAAFAGLAALALLTLSTIATQIDAEATDSSAVARSDTSGPTPTRPGTPRGTAWSWASVLGGDVMLGGYGGGSFTYPSAVMVRNPARSTDMIMRGFHWDEKPFENPIYYGLRVVSWPAGSRFGAMLDFTHAKAIARARDEATFGGILDGKPLPPKAPVRDVFKHLEFSHGHNIVTFNALFAVPTLMARLRPYAGIGAGITLPHTEVGFRSENGRTYEYQFAGAAAQGLAGLEVRLGRASVFFEYKFTYAPYTVPLSGTVDGSLLPIDLWRQFRAWMSGEDPPGGTLRTTLASHHTLAGVYVRANRPPAM